MSTDEDIDVEINMVQNPMEDTIEITRSVKTSSNNVEKERIEIHETNERSKLSCDFCKYMCQNQEVLTKHIDAKHAKRKKCWICGKNHEDTVHTDDEMFDNLNKLCVSVTNHSDI